MLQKLDTLSNPDEIKQLTPPELKELASEIRTRIIDVLSVTGGHLSSNLGIVELTLALHYVFDSPTDKLIFDVGHQTYVHKLLTGRNERFPSLRQSDGLSGFSHPEESSHDHFYSGHAGNALSLGLGVAKKRDLLSSEERVIPIIGDAALTCGLTLEAFNNIPKKLKKFLVVLNDNAMSISKNVGAVATILSRIFNSPSANHLYDELEEIVQKLPGYGPHLAKHGIKLKESMKNLISPAPFFEQFGLTYVGPVDGHDIKKLIETFQALSNTQRPTLVHVITVKGQGMKNAIQHPTPYHGAKPFNRLTGEFLSSKKKLPSFPKIFGAHILKMAEADPSLVAITPAMPVGSCLDDFLKKYPDRCIDVGIAEGHSVTYAGGVGHGGMIKVVACVYSSFLQRAFDNIYHDVCIQGSPIVIAIDRAGLASGDGVTAQGIYDLAFLTAMPGLVIAQPRNGHLLKELLESAFDYQKPVAIRYPNLPTEEGEAPLLKREVGKGELLAEGEEIVILSLGHMDQVALTARLILEKEGVSTAVIDPIFLKPLDLSLIIPKLRRARMVITVEEHSLIGGLGSLINSLIATHGLSHLMVKNFGLPDELIQHGNYQALLESYGLTAENIAHQSLAVMSTR